MGARKNYGADLIVTSTHGTTGLKHILLGSTAEYIVRHAPCPVFVVPSHERPAIAAAKQKYEALFSQPVMVAIASSLLAQVANSKPTPEQVQPLTYANIVSYFKAAGLRPTEVQKRCTIFFEGEWKNANVYSYGIILVENSDEDMQVTFYLTDAHEMNWITEFLDAPFFSQAETQKLFSFVNGGESCDRKSEGSGSIFINGSHVTPKFSSLASPAVRSGVNVLSEWTKPRVRLSKHLKCRVRL